MPEGYMIRANRYIVRKGTSMFPNVKTPFVGKLAFHPEVFAKPSLKKPQFRTVDRLDIPRDVGGHPEPLNAAEKTALGLQTPQGLNLGELPQTEDEECSKIGVGAVFTEARGKEMVIGIESLILRINLGTQGHMLWIPLQDYVKITSGGAKVLPSSVNGGRTFFLPLELQGLGEEKSETRHIRMIMAIIGTTHVLVVVDHNMLMQVRVGRLDRQVTQADLSPESPVWPHLWGPKHGPDWVLERNKALLAYTSVVAKNTNNQTPIATFLKSNTEAFNIVGEWQTADLLHQAQIHPLWQMSEFSKCPEAVERLKNATIAMAKRFDPDHGKTPCWPLTVQPRAGPYSFNEEAHKKWDMAAVKVYRKATTICTKEHVDAMRAMGLLNEHYTIGSDGRASWQGPGPDPTPSDYYKGEGPTLRVFQVGKTNYTAISAKLPDSGTGHQTEASPVDPAKDVLVAGKRTPTVGPFSFYLFTSGRLNSSTSKPGRPPKTSGPGPGRCTTKPTSAHLRRNLTPRLIKNTGYEKREARFLQSTLEPALLGSPNKENDRTGVQSSDVVKTLKRTPPADNVPEGYNTRASKRLRK